MQKKKKVTTSKNKTAKKAPAAKAAPKAVAKPAKVVVAPKVAAVKAVKVEAPKKAVAQKGPALKAAPEVKAATTETFKPRIDLKTLSADAQEQYKKWMKLQKQLADQKAEDYKMSADYELKAPLKHKVHGWGVVIQKRDNYIDVLFEVGMKTLIVNYKEL